MSDLDLFGKGWRYPFQITKRTGGIATRNARGQEVAIEQGKDKVVDGILQIIGTRKGSRPMLRDFGAKLQDVHFEPDDSATVKKVQQIVREAIERWEPRVETLKMRIIGENDNDGVLQIGVSFTLINSMETGNLIIPFAFQGDQLQVVLDSS